MVIDIHTHTFPDKLAAPTIRKLQGACHTRAFTDATNAGLAASMAQAGIDCSSSPAGGHQPPSGGPCQRERRSDQRPGPRDRHLLLRLHPPDCPDPRGELARIAALGLKGIKLHPAYQATRFDDIRYLRILDRAGELGLVVLTHAGIDIGIPAPTYCDPEMVLRALEQVGPVTLILAHMGGWRQWDQVEALLPQSSVLLDTAFPTATSPPWRDTLFGGPAAHDGTGAVCPLCPKIWGPAPPLRHRQPLGDQSADVASIRALPLSPEERDAILGGNAQRLLGL